LENNEFENWKNVIDFELESLRKKIIGHSLDYQKIENLSLVSRPSR
jgi:hypothetical protein